MVSEKPHVDLSVGYHD